MVVVGVCGGMSLTSMCGAFGVVQAVLYTISIVCGLPVVSQNFLENWPP